MMKKLVLPLGAAMVLSMVALSPAGVRLLCLGARPAPARLGRRGLLRVGPGRHSYLTLRSWPEPVLRQLPLCVASGACTFPFVPYLLYL